MFEIYLLIGFALTALDYAFNDNTGMGWEFFLLYVVASVISWPLWVICGLKESFSGKG